MKRTLTETQIDALRDAAGNSANVAYPQATQRQKLLRIGWMFGHMAAAREALESTPPIEDVPVESQEDLWRDVGVFDLEGWNIRKLLETFEIKRK